MGSTGATGSTRAAELRRREGRSGAASQPGPSPRSRDPRSRDRSRSRWSTGEVWALAVAALLLLYVLLRSESFHFHVAHAYARLGFAGAQHLVAQRYLRGAGVDKNEEMAMHWFRQAAGQGHPHSSFNLAVGALRNMTAALEDGEVEKLLRVAADQGLQEAQELLENILRNRNRNVL